MATEAQRERNRRWRAKNIEKVRAYHKEFSKFWYQVNREDQIEKHKRWYQEHKEYALEMRRKLHRKYQRLAKLWGICRKCGIPSEGKMLCPEHLEYARKIGQKRRDKIRAEKHFNEAKSEAPN